MRLSFVLSLLTIFCVSAKMGYSQTVELSMRLQNVAVSEVLDEIKRQSDFSFWYKDEEIDLQKKVSVEVNRQNIDQILTGILSEQGLAYTIDDKHIIIYKKNEKQLPQQPERRLTGTVVDESNEPVIGANILVKGTGKGVITDIDGNFSISVPPGSILQVSYIGYLEQSIAVENRENLQIILKEDLLSLDEVIIIGYGTVKKQNLTSSVSKISSEAIQDRPLPTLGEAFQGQLAGVRAQSTTGIPGEELKIRIRGNNTINGDSSPLYVIDGVPREDMGDINPMDVASIQILKDASATSIYGSRGANGVVLIETKQGTGKPTVTFDAYIGFQDPEKNIDIMDKDQWLAYNMWRRNVEYLRSGGSMSDPMSARPESQRIPDSWLTRDKSTDWQDAITRTAPIQNYQVSASARGDIGSIYFSFGYVDQQGIIKETDYKRMNFRLNASMNISEQLRFGINVAPSSSTQNDGETQGKETVIHHALGMSPLVGIDEATRDWGFPEGIGQAYPNPLERLKHTLDNTKLNRVATSVWGEYDIIQGLQFRTLYSYNYAGRTEEFYQPGNVTYANGNVTRGYSNAYTWTDWSIQNTLTYDKVFGDHALNILLGQSADEHKSYTIQAAASGWPNESVSTLNVATTPTKASTTRSAYRTVSFFGRASYDYKDRYLFTASLRNDGSSRFGSNRKWGVFPSFSAGWKINEESFLENVDWISLLKIRAAWGMAGNDRIGNYDYMSLLTTANTSWGDAVVAGTAPNNIENPDLQWESTKTTNIGFDFSSLNNRIQFNFDYYINKTDNLLFNVPIPYASGFNSFRTNLGSIQNRGWEIDLTSHNLTGKFGWSTSLNLSANKNKVLDMGDIDEFTLTDWDAMFITRVGGPVSQFYCYRSDGILTEADFAADGTALVPIFAGQEVGNVKYVDQNKDGVLNSEDLVPYGNNLPDLIYGMTNRFSWKNFEFSFLVQGQFGGDVLFLGQRQLDHGGGNVNILSRWLNCYKPDYESLYGEGENPYPQNTDIDMSWDGKTHNPFGKNENNSDMRIYSATFFRIKNISLSYTVPRKALSKTVLSGLKVYVSIDNLKTFHNYPGVTPETNSFGNNNTKQGVDYSTYPLSKKYILGVNVTF